MPRARWRPLEVRIELPRHGAIGRGDSFLALLLPLPPPLLLRIEELLGHESEALECLDLVHEPRFKLRGSSAKLRRFHIQDKPLALGLRREVLQIDMYEETEVDSD